MSGRSDVGFLPIRFLFIICSAASVLTLEGATPARLGVQPSHCGWAIQSMPPVSASAQYLGTSGDSPADVWMVGAQQNNSVTLAEHFDGATWSIVESPNPASSVNVLFSSSTVGPTDTWAVGVQENVGGAPLTLIEHWTGAGWSVVPSVDPNATNELESVTAIDRHDVWAVGEGCGPICHQVIEHFDGVRWYARYAPTVGAFPMLHSVSADASDDVWAVGETLLPDGRHHSRTVTLALHWDGARWTYVHSPSPADVTRFLAVKALAPNDVWAAGWGRANALFGHALIEHWDGRAWSVVPQPAESGRPSLLYSLSATSPTDVWAFGERLARGSILAEHWDGTTWSDVPVPPRDAAAYFKTSFAAPGGSVFAFGADQGPFGEMFACNP